MEKGASEACAGGGEERSSRHCPIRRPHPSSERDTFLTGEMDRFSSLSRYDEFLSVDISRVLRFGLFSRHPYDDEHWESFLLLSRTCSFLRGRRRALRRDGPIKGLSPRTRVAEEVGRILDPLPFRPPARSFSLSVLPQIDLVSFRKSRAAAMAKNGRTEADADGRTDGHTSNFTLSNTRA